MYTHQPRSAPIRASKGANRRNLDVTGKTGIGVYRPRSRSSARILPDQLVRSHLPNVADRFLSEFQLDHLKIAGAGEVYLESMIAESQHFASGQMFRWQRQCIHGMLRVPA